MLSSANFSYRVEQCHLIHWRVRVGLFDTITQRALTWECLSINETARIDVYLILGSSSFTWERLSTNEMVCIGVYIILESDDIWLHQVTIPACHEGNMLIIDAVHTTDAM